MDFNEIECDGVDWLRDWDKWRDLSTVMNFLVPQKAEISGPAEHVLGA
jgi:hypothetical protein